MDDLGRLLAVGTDAEVPRPPTARTEAFPDATLLPGLVNTHTHLELTGFAGQVEEDDFAAWIAKIIAVKAARSNEAFFEAASRGIRECWAQGVTTVCDTGSTGHVIAALDALGASGTAHHEVFGMHPEQCDSAMRAYSRELDRLARHATGRVTLGLSPHAPYTVSGPLYRAAAELARAHGAPMAVHVAEPLAESQLLADFTGTFADMWKRHGVPRPTTEPITPVAWLDRHGVLGERTLCVHVIHADDSDMATIAHRGCSVAHCPRSNRRHHDADAPVRRFREAGLRIGLGTDSEVSVAPLDLIAEARSARVLAGWDATETVRALTLGGAEAIGVAAQTGSLTVGKWADVAMIRTGATLDPAEAVLAAGSGAVVGTWLSGREVHRTSGP